MLVLRRGAAVNSITAPLLSVLSETLANCRRRSEDDDRKAFGGGKYGEVFEGFHTTDKAKSVIKIPRGCKGEKRSSGRSRYCKILMVDQIL
ncbi:hypothetical protein HAX54_040680 [Datura stramonium]|uniref:Uncharacterized protein n=1 Tax=Datura stramonium TaxID=4076 RepID=A0ABS8SK97_DATST|nr:hypothetical protein [Datura stramonium]